MIRVPVVVVVVVVVVCFDYYVSTLGLAMAVDGPESGPVYV